MVDFKKLSKSTTELGKYHGVPDKDSKSSYLDRFKNLENASTYAQALLPPDPIDELITSMQSRSDLCPSTAILLEKLHDLATGDRAGELQASVQEQILISFEPTVNGQPQTSKPGVNTYVKSSTAGWTQGTKDGMARGKKAKAVSLRTMMNIPAGVGINISPDNPTKDNPNLSVIQIFDARKTPSSRDTGAVQVFMNAIPTLEFSKCVPFLDIVIIEDIRPVDDNNRLMSINIATSLLGSSVVQKDGAAFLLGTATDAQVLERVRVEDKLRTVGISPLAAGLAEVHNFSTAGMEMFLSPQTLPLMDSFSDYGETLTPYGTQNSVGASDDAGQGGASQSRPSAPIDRFRPLASILSFEVSISSSIGFIAFKTASMDIKCFDRSRLHELAALVRPSVFGGGRVKMLIEYGWAHPDGDDMITRNNAYGKFLNNLRSKEMYVVTNSSFTFEEDGSVNITLDLATDGGDSVNDVTIPEDATVGSKKKALDDLTKAIDIIRRKILGTKSAAKAINSKSFISSVATTSRALSINESTKKALKKFLASASSNRNPGFKELQTALKDLYGKQGNGGAIETFKSTLSAALGKKNYLVAGSSRKNGGAASPDPFLRTIAEGAKSGWDPIKPNVTATNKTAKQADYVSLGKVMALYVGQPLAASGKFEEIQLMFYAFNPKASYMRDFNIAQFPIHVADFKKAIAKLTTTGLQMPLSRFITFLRTDFVSNPSTRAYGFANLYEQNDENSGYAYKDEMKDSTVLQNEIQKTLDKAYGSGTESAAEDLEFKLPRLQFQVEAVALEQRPPPEGGYQKTLLRIHIYDAQNVGSVTADMLVKAAFDDTLGYVGRSAGTVKNDDKINAGHQKNFAEGLKRAFKAGIIKPVDSKITQTSGPAELTKTRWTLQGNFATIKRFISYDMPTIDYGSNSSAVKSMDLQTQNNALLATISYQRSQTGGTTAAPGITRGGMPMQINPITVGMTTFGCPLFELGQQFFIDMNTGTSADNVYRVSTVNHTLEPGSYSTDVDLINIEAFGVFRSFTQNVEDALLRLEELEAGSTAS